MAGRLPMQQEGETAEEYHNRLVEHKRKQKEEAQMKKQLKIDAENAEEERLLRDTFLVERKDLGEKIWNSIEAISKEADQPKSVVILHILRNADYFAASLSAAEDEVRRQESVVKRLKGLKKR